MRSTPGVAEDDQGRGEMEKGLSKDDYDPRSQNLVKNLAHKHPQPKTERHTRYFSKKEFMAQHDMRTYLWPKDGIDKKIVTAGTGTLASTATAD